MKCSDCRVGLPAIYFAKLCPKCRPTPSCDICRAELSHHEVAFGRATCDHCRFGELQLAIPTPPEIWKTPADRSKKRKNAQRLEEIQGSRARRDGRQV
jgi:hypothetical protein